MSLAQTCITNGAFFSNLLSFTLCIFTANSFFCLLEDLFDHRVSLCSVFSSLVMQKVSKRRLGWAIANTHHPLKRAFLWRFCWTCNSWLFCFSAQPRSRWFVCFVLFGELFTFYPVQMMHLDNYKHMSDFKWRTNFMFSDSSFLCSLVTRPYADHFLQ